VPRVLRIVLITLAVIVLLYGVYFILGRPALPIPAIRYKVSPGSQLYDLVMATESDELRLTVVTDGQIDVSGDGDRMASINYTPKTLGNALTLAGNFMGKDQQKFQTDVSKPIQNLSSLLFNILRFKLTVLIIPA
jgi:hypothetical protein